MDRGRVKLTSRGRPLVIAYRASLVGKEKSAVLPETVACAELDGLSQEAIAQLVEAFETRFPNDAFPTKSRRVLAYVRDRVVCGALCVARSS